MIRNQSIDKKLWKISYPYFMHLFSTHQQKQQYMMGKNSYIFGIRVEENYSDAIPANIQIHVYVSLLTFNKWH